jgi:hypothetical protein
MKQLVLLLPLCILLEAAATTVNLQSLTPRRAGVVRLQGQTFADEGGPYLALGTTMFPLPWMYRYDRPRLERNLAWVRAQGVDYIRAIASVGDRTGFWANRSTTIQDVLTTNAIAEATDLAYDVHGLRVQWTVLGGVQGTAAEHELLIGRVAQQLQGRLHKLQHLEVVNEGSDTFNDDLAQIRHLGRLLIDRLPGALVALTAVGQSSERATALHANHPAQLAIEHMSRGQEGPSGAWRTVLQSWETQRVLKLPWTNNEPIGPASSVVSDADPRRQTLLHAAAWLNGAAGSVVHTGAGVRLEADPRSTLGDRPANLWEVDNLAAVFSGIRAARSVLPSDLPNFQRADTGCSSCPASVMSGYPFDPTVVHPHVQRGDLLRAFAAVHADGRFVVMPLLAKRPVAFPARAPMTFTVFEPWTARVLETVSLQAGQTWTLQPTDAVIIVGRM